MTNTAKGTALVNGRLLRHRRDLRPPAGAPRLQADPRRASPVGRLIGCGDSSTISGQISAALCLDCLVRPNLAVCFPSFNSVSALIRMVKKLNPAHIFVPLLELPRQYW
jgi:hypothetical protein